MNKKRVLHILIVIVLLIGIISVVYKLTSISPKIIFTAEISTMSEENYKQIHSDGAVEKFKSINLKIKVVEPLGVTKHIKIESDFLNEVLENYDNIEIYSYNKVENGNGKESRQSIDIYVNDLSKEELISILSDFKCKITWENFGGNKNNKILYLKDFIK